MTMRCMMYYMCNSTFVKVASKLKSVEIFYSLCLALAQSGQLHLPLAVFTSVYPKLVVARRALALFQHHDAITGASITIFEKLTDYPKFQKHITIC